MSASSSVTVHIEGADRARAALLALIDPSMLQAAFRLIGEQARQALARYPGPPNYPLRWASRKQETYVKYVLRKGLGPYVRNADPMSQNLGKSWAVEVQPPNRVVVGTRVTYAPYVQSAECQQPFHADTGWVTDEQAVHDLLESGVVHRILDGALDTALRRA